MLIARRKVKNAIKNVEVAIARMEQLYATEYEMITTLKEMRIQLWGLMKEMDIITTIEGKSTWFDPSD